MTAMSKAMEGYRRLLFELELERLVHGGVLAQEVELAYAERFEPLWLALSADEQEELEGWFKSRPPVSADAELHEEDCTVVLNSSGPPRRAA
jgi:hypothetical protein